MFNNSIKAQKKLFNGERNLTLFSKGKINYIAGVKKENKRRLSRKMEW